MLMTCEGAALGAADAAARTESVQSVGSRRRAEVLTEGPVTWVLMGGLSLSPAEEQLNLPVSDPCCVLEINNL